MPNPPDSVWQIDGWLGTDGPNAGRVQEAPQSYIYRITDDEWICIHGAMAGDERPFSVEVFQRVKPGPSGGKTT